MAAEESGSGAVFKAIIQAVDKVSEPVHGITAAVKSLTAAEGKAGAEEKKMHSAGVKGGEAHLGIFQRLSNHVRNLGGHFGELGGIAREVGGAFAEMVAPLGALGGAGSLVGLIEMTNAASEAFSQMKTSAEQAGVSISSFATLSMAAKENDVSTQTLTSSLFRLSRTMGDVSRGKNKEAAALFAHLGIKLHDANGKALTASQILPQLADAFEHTTSATMRNAMAQVIFGRGGAALIPILLKGAAGLAEYHAAFKKYGYLPTGLAKKQLDGFHKSWVELSVAVSGFSMEIGTKLAPILGPIVTKMADWIAANRDWISTNIAGAVGELVKWVRTIDLHKVIGDMQHWFGTISSVAHSLGGIKVVVGAMVLALGSPLLTAVSSAMHIFGALKGVMMALTVALDANPIVLIGLAIAGAALLIYENWASIKPYMVKFWDAIKAVWNVAIGAIKFEIKSIVDAFQWVWNKIQPIVANIEGAVKWAANSWAGRELGLGGASKSKNGATGTPGISPPANAAVGPRVYRGGPHTFLRPGAAAAAAAPQHGHVKVSVALTGAPPGTRVKTEHAGIADAPQVDVGFAQPGVVMID